MYDEIKGRPRYIVRDVIDNRPALSDGVQDQTDDCRGQGDA